jgi:hypothetical protein
MASRNKPKDVSAWLGGNRGTVQSGSSTEQQVDTGGGEKDAVNSTLALGLAGAAGLTAAGVALKSGRVVNPVKAVSNLVNNQKVVVHGHPRPLIGNVIEPRSGSFGAQSMGKPVAFALDPRKPGSKQLLPEVAFEYANKPLKSTTPQISIATTSKNNIKNFSDEKILLPSNRALNYVYSTQPIPVSKTINATGNIEDVAKQLRRALRKEGVSLRGNTGNTIRKYASRLVEQRKKQRTPNTWRQ